MSTTFSAQRLNQDIPDGAWRPVNLSGYPYNLGRPVLVFSEQGHEQGTSHADKALALWDLWNLKP